MLMPWELLLLRNIPRMSEGSGGDNGNTGPGGANSADGTAGNSGSNTGGDNSDSGDDGGRSASSISSGDDGPTTDTDGGRAQIGGGPNATPGYGAGSMAAGAANIAGTSGGPEAAMANAAGTSVEGMVGAMVGADTGRSASSIGAAESGNVAPSVSPTSTSSIASVAAGSVPGIGTGFGGFSSANVSQGLNAAGVAGPSTAGVSGGLGSLGGLGGLGTGMSGISGIAGVSGMPGMGSSVAELGDTGPQGFSTSGISPSSTATDVSQGMSSVGMATGVGGVPSGSVSFANDAQSLGSSLAQAAATPAEGLSDMGLADPSGMGTGFTGMGTGSVGIGPSVDAAVQSISSFGAQNIGAYGTPGYSTPSVGVSPPSGMQAATVGVAAPPGISSISSQDLAAQLGAMTQPSAQPSMGAPTSAAPSISSYGFSGMTSAGLPGIAGSPAPSTSSLATAASVAPSSTAPSVSQGVSRSASSISAEDAPQEQTGIMGLLGSTPASLLANGVLSAAVPNYGLANLGVMALTGTSIYGQGVSLASGQGLQTGGGLMGLMGGASNVSPSTSPSTSAPGEGGGGTYAAAEYTSPVASQQTGEVINPTVVQRQPANPYGFNIADFVTRYDPSNYSDYLPVQGYRA